MNKNVVVKHNSLINASYNLSLIEQRIILLAILELRDHTHNNRLDYLAFDYPLEITVKKYREHFKSDAKSTYENIKSAVDKLFDRQISFIEKREDGKKYLVKSRWVSHVYYVSDNATVGLVFSPVITPLLTFLKDNLTSYKLKQVSKFTSSYAIRLYELLISWKSVKKTPIIQTSELRNKLGVEDNTLTRMSNFKSVALEQAIKQINKHSDINVTYNQVKEGRNIIGFSFSFEFKSTSVNLPPRPKVKKGSHDEGVWVQECIHTIREYYKKENISVKDYRKDDLENLLKFYKMLGDKFKCDKIKSILSERSKVNV